MGVGQLNNEFLNKTYKITSLGTSIFEGFHYLERVTIPVGCDCIGTKAFKNCRSLTSVVIPNSVMTIGDSAFEGCFCLEVFVPSSVTSIGHNAFKRVHSLIYEGTARDEDGNHWGAIYFSNKSIADQERYILISNANDKIYEERQKFYLEKQELLKDYLEKINEKEKKILEEKQEKLNKE